MATKKVTLGGLTDNMQTIREARRKIAAEDKKLTGEYESLEAQLLELMDKEGTTKCAGALAGASIGESEAFNFVDETGWDDFMAYVAKNKFFHLVQRRISAPSVRELFATKGRVPGLVPYVKRTINLRNL